MRIDPKRTFAWHPNVDDLPWAMSAPPFHRSKPSTLHGNEQVQILLRQGDWNLAIRFNKLWNQMVG